MLSMVYVNSVAIKCRESGAKSFSATKTLRHKEKKNSTQTNFVRAEIKQIITDKEEEEGKNKKKATTDYTDELRSH